jgi:hypothetical protein
VRKTYETYLSSSIARVTSHKKVCFFYYRSRSHKIAIDDKNKVNKQCTQQLNVKAIIIFDR